MIIGITGLSASGKDTVAGILEQKGFANFSLSDIIREYCRNKGQETTRENLIAAGKYLRETYGNDYLPTQVIKKIREQNIKNAVIVSLRHPDEIKLLNKEPDFKLVIVEAPIEMRFARTQGRQGRPEDKDTFEEFKAHENQERTGSASGQQVDAVMAMADLTIKNVGTIEGLEEKVDELMAHSNQPLPDSHKNRPNWDKYFMEIAQMVATRATCNRGADLKYMPGFKGVGAVIVRDRVILSTGYNGSPRGLEHCDEAGHELVDGHCIRTVHSEGNAVAQAAKNGISIDGGTIYTTASPCYDCLKLLINAGIKKVVYSQYYNSRYGMSEKVLALAQKAGIETDCVKMDEIKSN